jgi:16S rRNA (guanine(966)-N(2))-methyltransferase RsmD
MGAEALSRGAIAVVGIEQSGAACAVIQQNWRRVAHSNQTFQVIRADVVKRLPSLTGQQFDRIYFDPPYASQLYQPVLEAIAHHHLLGANSELAAEHSPDYALPEAIASLQICRQKTYGNTALTFYRNEE